MARRVVNELEALRKRLAGAQATAVRIHETDVAELLLAVIEKLDQKVAGHRSQRRTRKK